MSKMFTEQLTQYLTIPGSSIYPAAQGGNNNTVNVTGGSFNMSKIRRILGHVALGSLGANVTNLSAVFQSSNANNGTFTNVSGGATLTLNTTNSDGTIEMRADQLPNTNTWVQLAVYVTTNTNAGNTATFSASVFGGDCEYSPGNQNDFSTNTSLLNRQVM